MTLTPERLAEIKARHTAAIELYGEAEALDTTTAQDRADLLAEVDRLTPERDTAIQRAELAESAIANCVLRLKFNRNLTGKRSLTPSEWERGWWAAVDQALGAIDAPYVDAAIDMHRSGDKQRDALLTPAQIVALAEARIDELQAAQAALAEYEAVRAAVDQGDPLDRRLTVPDVLVAHEVTRKELAQALDVGLHLNWAQLIQAAKRTHAALGAAEAPSEQP